MKSRVKPTFFYFTKNKFLIIKTIILTFSLIYDNINIYKNFLKECLKC